MATAQQVFESSVRTFAASERLRLATTILDDLTATSAAALDYSDTWTEQGVRGSYRPADFRHSAICSFNSS